LLLNIEFIHKTFSETSGFKGKLLKRFFQKHLKYGLGSFVYWILVESESWNDL